jgi:hypothetical protein
MARRKPKWSALAVTNTALRIGVKVIASVEGGQTFISSPSTDTAVQSDFSSELELCRRPPRPILNQPLNDSATRSVHHRSTISKAVANCGQFVGMFARIHPATGRRRFGGMAQSSAGRCINSLRSNSLLYSRCPAQAYHQCGGKRCD